MKTSNEIEQIENYLFGKLNTPSRLLFEARLLIDPILKEKVRCQEKLYLVIRQSGRRKLRDEVEQIHLHLFSDPQKERFQRNVYQLFQKQ